VSNMLVRLAKDTDIGLGESYMKGEYEPARTFSQVLSYSDFM
jgi:hypothetical protein